MLNKLNTQFIISYLGLLPYLYVIIDFYLFYLMEDEIILNFIIYYTLIVFVFIGSINWNFKENVSKVIIIYSTAPSLISVFIILINLIYASSLLIILTLTIFLHLQLVLDFFLIFKNYKDKLYFYYLRLPLTLVISIFLLVIYFSFN